MKKFSIQRHFLSRKFVLAFMIMGAVCCLLMILCRFYLSDDLVTAFMPPAEIILIPLFVALYIALKRNRAKMISAIVPAILVMVMIWPVFYEMTCFLPSVVTSFTAKQSLWYTVGWGLHIVFLLYVIVNHFLTCADRDVRPLIRFNTKLCFVYSIFILIVIMFSTFGVNVYIVYYTSGWSLFFDHLVQTTFLISLQLVLFFTVNIAVSMQTFCYLHSKNLLDDFI